MKEKKDRVDDAQRATAAAVEEGILPGGGTAYIRCIPAVEKLAKELESDDEKTGASIVARALKAPLMQIAANAGVEPSIVFEKVRKLGEKEGYNALADTYGDMIASGIVDPTKVVRCALENAVSVASLLLSTDAMVADAPVKEKEVAAPSAHAGMDY